MRQTWYGSTGLHSPGMSANGPDPTSATGSRVLVGSDALQPSTPNRIPKIPIAVCLTITPLLHHGQPPTPKKETVAQVCGGRLLAIAARCAVASACTGSAAPPAR